MGMVWEMHAIAVLTSQIQIRYIIQTAKYSLYTAVFFFFFFFTIINIYIQSSSPQSDIDNDLVGDSCDTNQDRYEKVHHLSNRDTVSFAYQFLHC